MAIYGHLWAYMAIYGHAWACMGMHGYYGNAWAHMAMHGLLWPCIAIYGHILFLVDFHVFTHGGRIATGINAVEWAKQMVDYGAGESLLTSMDRDGTKKGFDIPLTKLIASSISVPLVASGGVGSIDHFSEGVIEGGASAVLAASVFHFGQVRISDVKANMSGLGLPVRL